MKCINESEICYLKYEKVFGIKNNMNIQMWNELKAELEINMKNYSSKDNTFIYTNMFYYAECNRILTVMKNLEAYYENKSLKEAGYS